MASMEARILLYSQLSPEERREVEVFVARRPAYAPLLEEARRWGQVLQEARRLLDDSVGDEALAYYLVSRRFDGHVMPKPLALACDRIEAVLAEDPVLRQRFFEMERRLEELEAESDPAAQFERLTGHRLNPSPRVSEGAPLSYEADRSSRVAPSRPASPPRLSRARMWAAASVMLAVLSAVALLARPPSLERMAFSSAAEMDRSGYAMRFRGTLTPEDSAAVWATYLDGLAQLRQAQRSSLRLFASFEPEPLARAGTQFEAVVQRLPDTSLLKQEALLYLAKVRLAQRDVPAAQRALVRVAVSSHPRGGTAARMLQHLHEHLHAQAAKQSSSDE